MAGLTIMSGRPMANHEMAEDKYVSIIREWLARYPAATVGALMGPYVKAERNVTCSTVMRSLGLVHDFVAAGQTQAVFLPHRMEIAWCIVFTDRPTLASASPEHEALLVTIHLTCVFKIVRAMAREDKFPGNVRRYRRTGHLRRKFSAADIIMIRKTFALIEVSAPVFTPSASRESSLAPSASACSFTPDAAIVVADDTPEAWPAFHWVTQGKTNALLMHVNIIGLFGAGYKHIVLVYGESYN